MPESMKFDPFNSRVCRDIRNRLSGSLMSALEEKDIRPVLEQMKRDLNNGSDPSLQEYIENRISRYENVLAVAGDFGFDDVFRMTTALWNEGLFYEVHEYLEYHWKRSSGDEKKILQALIRAAGTYVHLAQGNVKGAAKMAAKAVETLAGNQALLPAWFDLEPLLLKLQELDPHPPRLTSDKNS